jgi:transcriptional regulator with XRE-family HTH domain
LIRLFSAATLHFVKNVTGSDSESTPLELKRKQLYRKVGQRIRAERRKKAMTQQELADAMCVARASIANLELGRQQLLLHTVLDIAAVLNVPPTELLPPSSPPVSEDLQAQVKAYRGRGGDWLRRSMRRDLERRE